VSCEWPSPPHMSTLFPYTTLFRSQVLADTYVRDYVPQIVRPEMMERVRAHRERGDTVVMVSASPSIYLQPWAKAQGMAQVLATRSEEHTSELQSRENLVCRLLLEK